MSIDFKKLKNDLLFVPLGGAGEIGMNLNMYHYNGKWLIVDVGVGFADDAYPGVDIVVPNINFLVERRKDIVGIVLTHAHEDHIGGIPYLWSEIRAPIYTNQFTSVVLQAKLQEYKMNQDVPITVLPSNTPTNIGPFNIEMINVTHSILENNGILIKTDAGNIFHTGDWKIDKNPVIGALTDEKRLKEIGKEGVLAMVGDSTNIFNPGRSGSEGDLEESLLKLITSCKKGMVVVTTFASNVARLHSIAKAAAKSKRKVVLTGRSLWRMYRAALDCGYLDDVEPFLEDKAVAKLPREEILVISTGCQGEPLAAVNKFATHAHQSMKMIAGDTIIFSSKIIPGNEKRIYQLFNRFCKIGVEVLTERDHFVHVSGHPAQDEVAMMYKYIKPKIAVPVHGEAIHIHTHAKFAKEQGCQYAVELANGDVLSLSTKEPTKIGTVESGYTLIDGESMIEYTSPVMKTRRKIRDNGAIFVTLSALSKSNGTVAIGNVSVSAPGLFDQQADADFIKFFENSIQALKVQKQQQFKLEQLVADYVKKFIKKEFNKFPVIIVHVA